MTRFANSSSSEAEGKGTSFNRRVARFHVSSRFGFTLSLSLSVEQKIVTKRNEILLPRFLPPSKLTFTLTYSSYIFSSKRKKWKFREIDRIIASSFCKLSTLVPYQPLPERRRERWRYWIIRNKLSPSFRLVIYQLQALIARYNGSRYTPLT